jgi:Fe2+ or Zn2+ uptake regulation protein
LERRRFNLQRNGQAYGGHVKGHRDLGVIPCDKCGDTMDSKEINLENYQNALEWFLKNRENHTYIHKSGVNSNNKNWFRFAQGGLTKENYFSQLLSLKKLGFHIPDLNNSSSVHLVAEPFDLTENNRNILYCKSCENVLDFTVDIERSVAVKSFHKIKFPRQNVDI